MRNPIFFLIPLVCFLCCRAAQSGPAVSAAAPASEIRLKLLDMFLINDKYMVPGHPEFLQKNSRALGVDIESGNQKFTLGFIDYNGNGQFDDKDVDRVMITHFQNRLISINSQYGTRNCRVSGTTQYLQVDSSYYLVRLPDENRFISIQALPAGKPVDPEKCLPLSTYVPFENLSDMNGKTVQLGRFFGGEKPVYLFFWNLKPYPQTPDMDAQIKALDRIAERYADKITIVGLRTTFGEGFMVQNPVYLKEMEQSPWPNLISSESLYQALQQDLTFIQGVLADPSGKILQPRLSPKELLSRLESDLIR